MESILTSNILVVDDDPLIAQTIKLILEDRCEYSVDVAQSGRECLCKVDDLPPDLVLLDIHMPDLDGIHVLKKLRSRPECQDMPVLMVSVDAQLERMAQCFQAGANGYIIKPFDAADLYSQVRNAVARGQATKLQKNGFN
ncbi:MAG: response regulator [Anaerolineales bacterium]|nr:response regulator [Anaerolineales bacterium]